MRTTASPLALLALPALALATVKLSDFAPRAAGVQGACQAVYSQDIDACNGSDFSGGGCSTGCIDGLAAMIGPIQAACAANPPPGQNIITVYLGGNGPQSLCGQAAAAAASSAAAAASSASSTQAYSSSVASSTAAPSSTQVTSSAVVESSTMSSSAPVSSSASTPIASSESSTSSVASSTTTALAVNTTSSPAATSPSTAKSTASSTTSSAGSAQTSPGNTSGGGSPFDAAGTSAATSNTASAFLAIALGACSLLIFAR
ncbi:hypothetical protein LTR95_001703 [Oleoguttula sp. CCFEE 5521]